MDKALKIEFFSRLSVLGPLQPEDLDFLAENSQLRRFDRFQFIYIPDAHIEYLYFLCKGRVKTGSFYDEGKEIIKEILHPETIFGDMGLAGAERHNDYAQSLNDEVEVLVVRLSDFQTLMQCRPTLVFSCLAHLSNRLNRVEERLAKMVSKDARERIIEFLLEAADREGRRIGFETLVKHHLTQSDIASLTGTSRQTVTSVLNDLKKANLIHFKRNSILIRDVAKLA